METFPVCQHNPMLIHAKTSQGMLTFPRRRLNNL